MIRNYKERQGVSPVEHAKPFLLEDHFRCVEYVLVLELLSLQAQSDPSYRNARHYLSHTQMRERGLK